MLHNSGRPEDCSAKPFANKNLPSSGLIGNSWCLTVNWFLIAVQARKLSQRCSYPPKWRCSPSFSRWTSVDWSAWEIWFALWNFGVLAELCSFADFGPTDFGCSLLIELQLPYVYNAGLRVDLSSSYLISCWRKLTVCLVACHYIQTRVPLPPSSRCSSNIVGSKRYQFWAENVFKVALCCCCGSPQHHFTHYSVAMGSPQFLHPTIRSSLNSLAFRYITRQHSAPP